MLRSGVHVSQYRWWARSRLCIRVWWVCGELLLTGCTPAQTRHLVLLGRARPSVPRSRARRRRQGCCDLPPPPSGGRVSARWHRSPLRRAAPRGVAPLPVNDIPLVRGGRSASPFLLRVPSTRAPRHGALCWRQRRQWPWRHPHGLTAAVAAATARRPLSVAPSASAPGGGHCLAPAGARRRGRCHCRHGGALRCLPLEG